MSVKVENLRVYYRSLRGDVQCVDGVTFGIEDGEIMGLAGESGCGKSTLGKSLIRMDSRMQHMEGRVELDGDELPIDDSKAMNQYRFKSISIVPQYAMSAMTPTRKVGKMMEELLESRGVRFSTVKAELERRLTLVGLSHDVLGMYPIELSGGMKQRTVMVLSTLLNPALLIADEITSALDVSTQKAVAETLVEFRDRGYVKSMMVITHDLAILYQVADTILVMYAGKLAEKAPAEVIIDAPLHPYTQLLISSLPEVGVTYEEQKLTGIPGRPPPLLDPPTGCRFRERCPFAFEKCVEEPPFRRDRARPRSRLLEGDLMLQLERVTKVYKIGTFGGKTLTAVRDVSFDLRPGEVVSLIGESGSGKSTVGKMILRLTPVTDGSISFEGTDVSTLERRRLKGYHGNVQGVFQDPFSSYNPIFKIDRVFSMIRGAYLSGMSGSDWSRKLDASLHAVSLEPEAVLGKYPHQLSGGQLQRLLIARALLLDIKYLVADEIISMLDASTRIDVLNLLGDLKARGLGVLFITHDLSLGNYISERTVILRRGSVVEMGATEKVFGNPMHPYTKLLIASVPHLHKKWEQVEQEVGGVPDERAIREPDDVPLLQEVEDDHLVALGPDAR